MTGVQTCALPIYIPETYVHRIGRTGRAGNTGIAISFCDAEERDELRDIQKLINKQIPVVDGHPYPLNISATIRPAEIPKRVMQKHSGNFGNAQRGGNRNFSSRRQGNR